MEHTQNTSFENVLRPTVYCPSGTAERCIPTRERPEHVAARGSETRGG